MSTEKPGRADYHREHQARAEAEAQRLLARRDELQGRWLALGSAGAVPAQPA